MQISIRYMPSRVKGRCLICFAAKQISIDALTIYRQTCTGFSLCFVIAVLGGSDCSQHMVRQQIQLLHHANLLCARKVSAEGWGTWKVMGCAVGCSMGLEGCRGDPPKESWDAAMGVRASLMPPGMRSATYNFNDLTVSRSLRSKNSTTGVIAANSLIKVLRLA